MDEDTIAAIATAPGEGGIAVIRISGPSAPSIAASVFRPKFGGDVALFAGYTVHYGVITDICRAAAVDDALLTVFRAPRSYTGEDICEIACHGGSATTGAVLDLVLRAGARIALPGEFTQRAFLNGRMDLAQAEAVADLVRARTESARKLARRQLDGDVSRAAAAIRSDLIGIVAAIEVTIDFSDEVGDLHYPEIRDRLNRAMLDIIRLLNSAGRGRILREGLSVAIVGRPNVGKSTLLNAMLRSERAIVTPIPGTTRDTIEESVAIRGLPVVLTDTAGIRETDDAVERIGVERAKEVISTSDIALLVLDAADGITPDDISSAHLIREARETSACEGESNNCIIVWNKRDLVEPRVLDRLVLEAPSHLGLEGKHTLSVSAANRAGIEQLEEALVAPYLSNVDAESPSSADPIESVVVSNARHAQALEDARVNLTHAVQSAHDEMPGDFIALDVRGALDALGQITGETVTDDIIHRIFKDFCVGK
jgi:tRNA modification GTPase